MSVSLWDRVSLVVLAHASFRYKMPSPAHSCHTEDLHREHDPTVSRFWFFFWASSSNKKVLSNFTLPSFYLTNGFFLQIKYCTLHFSNTNVLGDSELWPDIPLLHPTPKLSWFWITRWRRRHVAVELDWCYTQQRPALVNVGRVPHSLPHWINVCHFLNLASGFTNEIALYRIPNAHSFSLTTGVPSHFLMSHL